MWYSATQIGISEIDMDHQNIDAMLELCFTGHVPEAALKNAIAGLVRHFKHEEDVIVDLGHDFPADHQAEHMELANSFAELEKDWQEGRISGKELAETLRIKLLLHVTEYDLKLKDL